MSNAIITTAGMALLANLQSQNQSINIDQFIYGYIENLDINSEPSANSTKPEESNIVYTATLTKVGYVDDQTIIYSNRLDTTIGDFSYNWVGLYCSDHDTLIAVSHVPTVQKKKTVNDILGNTLCKNFAIQYTSIKSLANVTIAADESQLIGDLYALTTHTHDERYPLKNHHHNELYAAINHTHDDMATGGINENILINGEGLINTYDTNKQFIHQSSRYYIDRHFWEITDEGSITWNPTTGARTVDSGGGYPWKLEQKFDAADLIKHRIYGAKATAKMACNFDHTINIVLVDNSNTETIINGTLNSDNSVTFDIPEFNSNLKTFIVRFSAETNGIITNFKLEEGDKFTGYPITSVPLEALKCNKYREVGMFISTPGGTNYAVRPAFKMPKRCEPNITVTSLSGSNNRISSWNLLPNNLATASTAPAIISYITNNGFIVSSQNHDANYTIAFNWIADAEI